MAKKTESAKSTVRNIRRNTRKKYGDGDCLSVSWVVIDGTDQYENLTSS